MDDLLSIHFGVYVALAFVLYAIRRALRLSKRYIPILAIGLGLVFSYFEAMQVDFDSTLRGIKYALYGMGAVETIKYSLLKKGK